MPASTWNQRKYTAAVARGSIKVMATLHFRRVLHALRSTWFLQNTHLRYSPGHDLRCAYVDFTEIPFVLESTWFQRKIYMKLRSVLSVRCGNVATTWISPYPRKNLKLSSGKVASM